MKHAAVAVLMMGCALAAWGRGAREGATVADAARTVDETRAAATDGLVDIATTTGSVTVRGWDRAEVKVTGTIEPDVVALDIGRDGSTTTIEVRVPEPGKLVKNPKLGAALEIFVPAGTSVRVSSIGAKIEVIDVDGLRDLQTLGGSLRVKGGAGPVLASTLGGAITVEAPSSRVQFSTATGTVTISGVDGEVAGRTMDGSIRIAASRIVDADISTMSGDITIDAEIAKDGRLKAVAELGGRIDLTVPADVEGRFTLSCRADAMDMASFKPRRELAWVFRERADTGTMALTVLGGREGRAAEAAARALDGAEVRVDGGRVGTVSGTIEIAGELPSRLLIGGAMNEFTVGTGGARIYLETSLLGRATSGGPSIVLRTR